MLCDTQRRAAVPVGDLSSQQNQSSTLQEGQHQAHGMSWCLTAMVTLLSLLPVVTVVCGGGSTWLLWYWPLESWHGREKEDRPCFWLAAPFQTPSAAYEAALAELGVGGASLELPQLCSCHQVWALPSLVGCWMGMAGWGHSYQLLVAQATASHNLLNKPIKWQTGLEPPAAWGRQ